ncbi:hypothetical protein GCM10007907_28370 [Chitinimonas prasina]|uniref:Sulfatase-modifying factor enzyme-like domain-containing protein n=1 Tax=Chitinimonas prasina TaxID=1434937 RepID=A0ABQ5YHQ8_9NEIS|nr:formylglycine-generating enzyme family protein [Chitinimonas prasina]GLR14047.1 hypothetical protein GCM10007907_28370 [Chitinimonas prasina]
MVEIPAGQFTMGSPEEEGEQFPGYRLRWEGPQHPISIRYKLAISKFNITFEEWQACTQAGGCNGYQPDDHGRKHGRLPVWNVSWDDAQSYLLWLSNKTGKSYRLLSEAEWEYAARAGTTTPYYTGERFLAEQGNFLGSIRPGKVTAVGLYPANPFGLHDMVGNVRQWTQDCLNRGYHGAPADGSPWLAGDCNSRIIRGGSWVDEPPLHRSARRIHEVVSTRSMTVGFRVARVL